MCFDPSLDRDQESTCTTFDSLPQVLDEIPHDVARAIVVFKSFASKALDP